MINVIYKKKIILLVDTIKKNTKYLIVVGETNTSL